MPQGTPTAGLRAHPEMETRTQHHGKLQKEHDRHPSLHQHHPLQTSETFPNASVCPPDNSPWLARQELRFIPILQMRS